MTTVSSSFGRLGAAAGTRSAASVNKKTRRFITRLSLSLHDAESSEGLGRRHAGFDRRSHLVLGSRLFERGADDVTFDLARDDEDAVDVAEDDVTGVDTHPRYRHW